MSTRLVLLALALAAASLAVASAATLPVTAERLTTDVVAGAVPTTTCTVTATADATVDEASADTADGSATAISVRSLDTGRNRRLLVEFDLSSCGIGSSAAVRSATLTLYLSAAPSSSRDHDLYRATSDWTEGTVTWNTQPSVAASASASVATGTASGVSHSWTVTDDVADFVAGSATNHGWLLRDRTEEDAAGQIGEYGAREHATAAQRPVLEVTYHP